MKILCPIDVSEHSFIALDYALELSKLMNADLHVLTVFEFDSTIASNDFLKVNLEKKSLDIINKILDDRCPENFDRENIKTEAIRGIPGPIINEYADKANFDLIIMGKKDKDAFEKIIFGSVAINVTKNANVPVLVVPEQLKNMLTTNDILLALDDKVVENESSVELLRTIASRAKQKIDVIHISNKANLVPVDPFIFNFLGDQMGEVHIKEGSDAAIELKKYCESNDIGLLAMIRRGKNLLKRLLIQGVTTEELTLSNIPILILP